MIPDIVRQTSAFILSRRQPDFQRFLYTLIDYNDKLIGIKGARGSGKTTLMLQYAKNFPASREKILYLACDHPAMIDADLFDLATTWYQEGGKLLLIDEIHKHAGFAAALKAIKDALDIKVVFSGSSALRMNHELADLSRRAVVYELPVLSLREFIEIETGEAIPSYGLDEIVKNHQSIAADICSRLRPIEYFAKYCHYGSYPFYLESAHSYRQKLLEVINVTIDSDLCGLFNIEPVKADKLKKILYMLCSTPPTELNKSKLSSAVGTSWPTLAKYLTYMQAGSLIHVIPAGKGMRTVNKPDKFLLNNPNLFYSLCAAPNPGSIRESFFLSQLSYNNQVHYHDQGDYIVNDTCIFEIGGATKSKTQLKQQPSSYLAIDNTETGAPGKIPLWLLGMGY